MEDGATADGAVDDTAMPGEDAGMFDAVTSEPGVVDAPCVDPVVPPPCLRAEIGLASEIDTLKSSVPVVLTKGLQLAMHLRMPRNGRIEKVMVRMLSEPTSPGAANTVSLQAFTGGCTPKPLGKVSLPVIDAQSEWSFPFTSPLLPPMAKDTEINFVLTTDSEGFHFRVFGAAPPVPNTYDLFWAQRSGFSGEFKRAVGSMLSFKVFTFGCGVG